MSEFIRKIKRFFTSGSEKEDSRDVHFVLSAPKKSINDIEKLADITGIKRDQKTLAKFFEDSVKMFQWVLFHQSRGKKISALGEEDVGVLIKHHGSNDQISCLSSLIAPGKEPQAKEYFKNALE